jgi:outer membrane protein assembly factor BamD
MPACFRSNNTTRWVFLLALLLTATVLTTTGCRKDKNLDDRNAAELYRDAKRYLDNQSWARAIQSYKTLQTRYPFGRYTEQSMLDLSYANFKAGDTQSALSTLDRFIRTYPTHPNVDYAYYLKGLVNYEQNLGFLERMMPTRVRDRDQSSARDAFLDFSELLRRFPNSRYVPDARQRMVFLRNNLADYEIMVAEYYIRREAYIAAVNRARYVLEVYPNTPATLDALIVLHKSYTELEMPQLADSSWEVLALNYPGNYYVLGEKPKRDWLGWLWPFD